MSLGDKDTGQGQPPPSEVSGSQEKNHKSNLGFPWYCIQYHLQEITWNLKYQETQDQGNQKVSKWPHVTWACRDLHQKVCKMLHSDERWKILHLVKQASLMSERDIFFYTDCLHCLRDSSAAWKCLCRQHRKQFITLEEPNPSSQSIFVHKA